MMTLTLELRNEQRAQDKRIEGASNQLAVAKADCLIEQIGALGKQPGNRVLVGFGAGGFHARKMRDSAAICHHRFGALAS
jgi:hypothetical protein